MENINGWDELQEQVLRAMFSHAMRAARQVLGIYAFRKYYGKQSRLTPINKALFEVWSVHLSRLSEEQIERLAVRSERLLASFHALLVGDAEFHRAVSVSTGDARNVRLRFKRVGDIIQETLDAEEPAAS